MRSIVSKSPQCLICELPTPHTTLYKHHIFNGEGKEQLSEQYGCWCYLCARHYYMCNAGVYFNPELDRKLKRHTQKRFNEFYPDLDFMRIFGKSYIGGEHCLICGDTIPEGRQICPNCERSKQ